MIELRWVHRQKIKSGIASRSKVLQSRTQVMQMVSVPATEVAGVLHLHTKPMGYTWTEWKDVPDIGDEPESPDDIGSEPK